MRLSVLIASLFAAGCCISLPKLPAKRVAFPRAPAATLAINEQTFDWHDAKRDRDVPVRIYAPVASEGRRFPVVVFSHGIGEDRDSYVYLGRALAARGYVAVHVTHAGTDKAVLKKGYRKLYQATKEKANWQNRPLDVSFVLDQIAARSDVDLGQVAVVGHSAGAFTAFALAGFEVTPGESFRDPRVKVIVPMSMPKIPGSYAAVSIPTLNLTGTCDSSPIYRTWPRDRRVPFTKAPHATLITIAKVNHNTFSNAEDELHPLIVDLTVAFLDAHLRGDAGGRAWFAEPGTAELAGVKLAVETK